MAAVALCLGLPTPASGQNASFEGASAAGTRVFFETNEQLAAADTDAVTDVYERSGSTTKLVSKGEINGNGAIGAQFAEASADGTVVFFTTNEQLVAADTDAVRDIYMRSGGTTTRVSGGAGGGNGNFQVDFEDASADGTRVFFNSLESLAPSDADSSYDIYVHDVPTLATAHVSRIIDTLQTGSDDGSLDATFEASPDGVHVFWSTNEQMLPSPDDTDAASDIYTREVFSPTAVTVRVSTGFGGGNGNFDAIFDAVTSDGSQVFFDSEEVLEVNDTDTNRDVFRRNLVTSIGTARVSKGELDSSGNGAFDAAFDAITNDGAEVYFDTFEPIIPASDTDERGDIYVKDLDLPPFATGHASIGPNGGNGDIDANFQGAAPMGPGFFETQESLVASDLDTASDIYDGGSLVTQGEINGNGEFDAQFGGTSALGDVVFFQSEEPLVTGDADLSSDVYQRAGGATAQVSRGQVNGNGAFSASFEGASTDGSTAFFTTREALVPFDTDPGDQDVYERSAGTTRLVSAEGFPPDTSIESIRVNSRRRQARVSFAGDDPSPASLPLRFKCKIDGRPFRSCSSPKTYRRLKPGRHQVQVKATDAAGNPDPMSARRRFRIAR